MNTKTLLRFAWPIVLILGLIALRPIFMKSTSRTGEALYIQHCANCHQEDGKGLGELYPPLAQADYLAEHQAELPCMFRYGMKGEIQVNGTTYNQEMPGVAELSEHEILHIINYINQSWGNELPDADYQNIMEALEECE